MSNQDEDSYEDFDESSEEFEVPEIKPVVAAPKPKPVEKPVPKPVDTKAEMRKKLNALKSQRTSGMSNRQQHASLMNLKKINEMNMSDMGMPIAGMKRGDITKFIASAMENKEVAEGVEAMCKENPALRKPIASVMEASR